MLSFAAAVMAIPRLPLRPPPHPELRKTPRLEIPQSDSFFVASVGDELSQKVLYHALGESISHARQADILLLGDSRAQMGLREDVIVPAAARLGLRVFTLACGHAERLPFFLEVIRKNDLRPKIVVAVGGEHIWGEDMSGPAERAVAESHWEAWKEWIEGRAAWNVQRVLHSYLPRVDFFDQKLEDGWVMYRSARTGWWRPALQPTTEDYPIDYSTEDTGDHQGLLPFARKFKNELDARGTLLVLSIVPYGDTRARYLPFLSHALSVPAVVPSFEGMFTSDVSHLGPKSSRQYSHRFWTAFIAVPEVRRRLGLPAAQEPPAR